MPEEMTTKDRAIHILWEKHCSKQRGRRPWPPSDREVQEEMDAIDRNSDWDDRLLGS